MLRIFFFTTSIFLFAFVPPTKQKTKKISKKDLQTLYGPTFKNFKSKGGAYDYGTVRSGDSQYYEGFQGLFNYADYPSDGVNNFLNRKSSNNWGSIEHYEKLAGMKMHITDSAYGEWGSSSFHHYNPVFINWLTKNMIPPAGFSIKGVTAKYMYRHYSRFFRLLAESYLYLNKNGSYDTQAKSYIDAVMEAKKAGRQEDGLDILFGTYHYALNGYEPSSESDIPSPFESHMAFGFWLRRNLDGTHDEAYECLSKIMNRFDKRWFKMIRKKYSD